MEIRFHAVTDGAERHKKSSRSGDPIGLCRCCTSGSADNHHSSDEKKVSSSHLPDPTNSQMAMGGGSDSCLEQVAVAKG